MQKIIILIFCSLFALQLSAADYRVLLLGDIHYDHLKYHTSAEGKIISRYSKVHVAMWQKKQPSALFTAAARQLDKDVPFVLQLGDFIEGCKNFTSTGIFVQEMHYDGSKYRNAVVGNKGASKVGIGIMSSDDNNISHLLKDSFIIGY